MAIGTMLGAIENMMFFLQTGFGDSTAFAAGQDQNENTRTMARQRGIAGGMGSHKNMHFLRSRKEGSRCKISLPDHKTTTAPIGNLYVGNTDILQINLTKNKCIDEVHTAIQGSVNSWGKLLIATGGVLQPQKCFYSVISFDWKNSEWQYAQNATRDDLRVTVPLPDRSSAMISHKKISHAKKTLGAMTSPDGDSTASISMMQEKAQDWINAVQSGHMHRCNVWFSLKVQFWPRVGYGLCSSMATLHELDNALH